MDELQLRELIKKKCWDTRYHNSLKYMIHNCEDREIRNQLLTLVFLYDPYLAAKIYMTMCDNSAETLECIDSILGPVKEHAKKQLKKANLLMAYLELGRLEDFYAYYDRMYLHLEKKVYTYMVKRLSYEQLLYLADAVLNHKQTKYYSLCFDNIRFKYTPEYDQVLVQLIQKLFESNQYSICWKLIVGIGKDSSLRMILGEELTDQYVRKLLDIGLNKAHTYGLYLILRYGYSIVFENSKEVIHNIVWDKTPIRGSWVVYFYVRFLNKHELDLLEQELVIKKMGFSKDVFDIYIVNNPFQSVWNIKKMTSRLLQKLKMDPILLEQHLVESLNTLQYPYSAREKFPASNDSYTEDKNRFYALFEKYMSKEKLPKRIVFLFFNSLFRYLINLEYVVLYLKQHFSLSEVELKDLLKEYILYGKVYKINANSVSIRCKNVLTTQTCCMYNRKCSLIRDGVTVLPQLGENIYFKFDYIYEEIPKINVYLPAYTLEEMFEDKKVTCINDK